MDYPTNVWGDPVADPLPAVDDPPKEWGPDHDDIQLTEDEIAEGNRQGDEVDVTDDDDNGL